MKKIEVNQYAGVHYIAGCYECSFDTAINYPKVTAQDVRNKVRAHVLKSGHTCWIEKGDHTEYSLVDDEAVEQGLHPTSGSLRDLQAVSTLQPLVSSQALSTPAISG